MNAEPLASLVGLHPSHIGTFASAFSLPGFSGISVERPLWLVGFALVALVMAYFSTGFGVMSPARRWLSALVRVALLLLIGACVAGVGFVRATDKLAVIAVIDQSESVRRFGALSGRDFSQRIADAIERGKVGRGPDDLFGIVVFDGKALTQAAPSAARSSTPILEVPGAEGTNIEGALRLARALIPPDAAGKIILFSDGNQTRGNAEKAVAEFASGSKPIPIDIVPLEYKLDNEVFVASVDAPSEAPANSNVRLRITLFSTSNAGGNLRVFSADGGSQQLASQSISLEPGENIRTVQVPLGPGRVHRFRAVFEPATGDNGQPTGDTLAENNSASAFTLTPGAGSVLVVDGPATQASPLAQTLAEDGLRVESLPARLVPTDPLALQGYDLVILQNVGAEELPDPTQRLLASGVRDMGLGLIMVGGTDSFGAGGWRATPIEPILPVLLDLPERLVEPEAAVIFILDNSGSMNRSVMGSSRSQQEIANQAAAIALGTLDRRDLVGVIAFNSNHTVIQPLSPNRDPTSTASAILSIGSGGGTNLAPPLVDAANQLEAVKAKNKYVIVLSDGVSQDKDRLPAIAERMAQNNIHISTIAIGDDADTKGMEEIANIGNGQFYEVVNPSVLPRVFMRAMKLVRSPLIREEPFEPIILPTGAAATVGLGTPPKLLGLCLTQPRPDPTVINEIVTPSGEPVLSQWRVELGQVAAFTSDASRWAADWLEWPGYRRMWTQLARSIGRSQTTSTLTVRAQIIDNELVVRVEGADGSVGNAAGFSSIPATVFTPSGGQVQFRATQIAPGVFEGRMPVADEGAYIAVLRPTRIEPGKQVERLPPIIAGASHFSGRETRDLASNRPFLANLASLGKGQLRSLENDRIPTFFGRDGLEPVRTRTPLWPSLLVFIPFLFLLDVAVRRIAWDRWFHREAVEQAAPANVTAATQLAQRVRASGSILTEPDSGAAPSASSQNSRHTYSGVQLSSQDADRLAAQARDQRRAARMAAQAPAPQPPSAEKEVPEDSLLAAKRRARARFEENQSD